MGADASGTWHRKPRNMEWWNSGACKLRAQKSRIKGFIVSGRRFVGFGAEALKPRPEIINLRSSTATLGGIHVRRRFADRVGGAPPLTSLTFLFRRAPRPLIL